MTGNNPNNLLVLFKRNFVAFEQLLLIYPFHPIQPYFYSSCNLNIPTHEAHYVIQENNKNCCYTNMTRKGI